MDVAFFFLLWISSPEGAHSEIFGDIAGCREKYAAVKHTHDTLYLSECIAVEMKFVQGVRQEYQRPSEVRQP